MSDYIAPLPLKRLHTGVEPLLTNLSVDHRVFSQITHHELFGDAELSWQDAAEIWSGLSRIPQLTHLSFNDEAFIPICPELLESCASLSVLIYLESLPGGHRFQETMGIMRQYSLSEGEIFAGVSITSDASKRRGADDAMRGPVREAMDALLRTFRAVARDFVKKNATPKGVETWTTACY
ncbi:hypothetical protein B0H13DRAFT_1903418 [Mycena leptocephala]|nr:hypothetical protein B0H13DRAFT_1903418 [Mycena leptocephala]